MARGDFQSKLEKDRAVQEEKRRRYFTSGTWFMLKLDLSDVLSPEENVVLCYLINHENKNLAEARASGWFYCTAKKVHKAIGVNERTQTRVFTALRRLKIVETDWRGQPAKRYIHINYEQLEEYADAYWVKRENEDKSEALA